MDPEQKIFVKKLIAVGVFWLKTGLIFYIAKLLGNGLTILFPEFSWLAEKLGVMLMVVPFTYFAVAPFLRSMEDKNIDV